MGAELRVARAAAGLSQSSVAERAGLAQTMVSRIERGCGTAALETLARVAAAVGHDLSVRLYPATGISLRDSGQLSVAAAVGGRAHASWTVRLEAPIGADRDRRAADMLLLGASAVVHVEIERRIVDLQAQLRAAQLKRVALAERHSAPVRLVIALPESPHARAMLRAHGDALRLALPLSSRRIWAALASGADPGGDGLLWVRPARRRQLRPAVSR